MENHYETRLYGWIIAQFPSRSMRSKFGNELCYQITGQISFEPCWPAAKVLWVKENEPTIFEETKHILLLEDYIIYQLTGQFVAEGSLLTSTLYWNISTKQYWKEMLDFIGISSQLLPRIMESGQLVGTIVPEMAKYWIFQEMQKFALVVWIKLPLQSG
jgi:xylulokinase